MDLSPHRPKNSLINDLLDYAQQHDVPPSVSKAGRVAAKIQRGEFTPTQARIVICGAFNPDNARLITWADPTGEKAVRNAMKLTA